MNMPLSEKPHSAVDRITTPPRARIIVALALSTLAACSKPHEVEKKTTSVSASASVKQQNPPKPPIKNPLICINGSFRRKNEVFSRIGKALRRAGARVKRINPGNFASLSPQCNGVFVMGGGDLDVTRIPQREAVHPASRGKLISWGRQKSDRRLITWTRETQIPLFGECLGMQEIGVWEGEGAKFDQNIPDDPHNLNHRGFHSVNLTEEASVFGIGLSPTVKSNHHQALEDPLPRTLKVVGRSRDKIIEAIISTDGLVVGIGWHPRKDSEDEKIYNYFVEMVAQKGAR